MNSTTLAYVSALLVLLGATACGSEPDDGPDHPAQCNQATAWSEGQTLFEDTSDEWGLPDLGADGVRINAVDFNGDNWADLVVRHAAASRNDYDGGRTFWLLKNNQGESFQDVTQSSEILQRRDGADGSRRAEVVAWADVNNDGHLDANTGFNRPQGSGGDTAEIMLNDGDGTFSLAPADNDLRQTGSVDVPASASFVDYNRDGNVDLWVAQYAGEAPLQDRLYRGEGDGTFTDVTDEAGVITEPWRSLADLNQARAHTQAWSGAACDLNDDGSSELLSASYGRAPNHLWRADRSDDGSVSYSNISIDSGYAFDDQMDWHDNASARCHCELNPGAPKCGDVPPPERIRCQTQDDAFRWNHEFDREPFRLGGNSGTTVCADIDADGSMDLLTTEIRHWDVGSSSDPSEILYNTEGDSIVFERPGREATGLTRQHPSESWDEGDITAGVFDADNDARPDIYIGSTDYPGTRGHLWRRTADGTYEKVPKGPGIDHTSSHGIGLADFDHDGDVDVVVGHSDNRCGSGDHCYPAGDHHVRMFENQLGHQGNWLQLQLSGSQGTNRSAVGARVKVTTERGTQTQDVGGGHGHYGIQHSQRLHFGLGEACEAEVTVRWPNQELTTETFTLKAGRAYSLTQGGEPQPID
jgi:hypothetical protein